MRQAELSARALHDDDRRELLVEGWARAGDCGRALELAAGGPQRFLLRAVDECADASQLDLLEQVRGDLDGTLRDEFTARLVEAAVRHGQVARATRLAATLRPPSLVPALLALALGHVDADPALFPPCPPQR